ncbi:ABC transporter ATP-binding protein [Bacillus sp. TS-2]|nr:ABC transporter ATP-binding protein [Bacillus sp. TS-2]
MIELINITKKYGNFLALNKINLTINKGEIVGFLGRNGAGKSTLMNILTGYISMNEGEVRINGIDILEEPEKVKKNIGYLPEIPPLYVDMTVKEYLRFVCKLKEVSKERIQSEILEKMSFVSIEFVQNKLIKHLSKGFKQRVGLAQALIGNPELLVLDEPTSGLDPKEIIEFRQLIMDISKNSTVILSSHILSEVQALCHKVMIINEGQPLLITNPNEYLNDHLIIRIKATENEIITCLQQIPFVKSFKKIGSYELNTLDFLLISEEKLDIREAVFRSFSHHQLPLLMMKQQNNHLENLFLHATNEKAGVKS